MIKVYVLPNCQRCEDLKNFMRKNHVAYREMNIETDPKALAKMTMAGIEQYPVVEIDNHLYFDNLSMLKEIVLNG